MMWRPPSSMTSISFPSGSLTFDGFDSVTPGPSLMSVPRPAMFVAVVPHHRLVRRDDRDLEFIDLIKLGLFRLRRAGHAGQFLVHAEVVLDGDRRHRLRLALHADAFLGFDRLMQPLRPPAPRHRAP